MAEQTGIIKLSGKLGDLVHYERGGKHFSKTAAQGEHKFSAGSVAAQHSFGLGSAMGKQLKSAFKPLLDGYKYQGIHNRLTEICKQIYRAGPLYLTEKLYFTDYNIKALTGFNFNKFTAFDTLVIDNPVQLDYHTKGIVDISIRQHRPTACFFRNTKTRAAALQFLFSIIDLETSTFSNFLIPEIVIPFNQTRFPGKKGKIQLSSLDNKLLLCTAQVRYYCDNELQYYSGNRKLIAAQIDHVAHMKEGAWVDYPQPIPEKSIKKADQHPTTPIIWE
ncbi:hypothetical protein GCM10023231_27290 [Olivibacter ginsenosidimutans]|uniref:HNH endonuclease n=1 Tax=Olivibacter ginsenosidimutans TaxID=1176537 RepID=A0ABP9BLG8_9SPHI